jgi:hypothetical protein
MNKHKQVAIKALRESKGDDLYRAKSACQLPHLKEVA